MKEKPVPPIGDCLAKYLAHRLTKKQDRSVFEEIEESDPPHVVVTAPDKSSVVVVLRKHLEKGIPEDFDTLFEMAALGEFYEEES